MSEGVESEDEAYEAWLKAKGMENSVEFCEQDLLDAFRYGIEWKSRYAQSSKTNQPGSLALDGGVSASPVQPGTQAGCTGQDSLSAQSACERCGSWRQADKKLCPGCYEQLYRDAQSKSGLEVDRLCVACGTCPQDGKPCLCGRSAPTRSGEYEPNQKAKLLGAEIELTDDQGRCKHNLTRDVWVDNVPVRGWLRRECKACGLVLEENKPGRVEYVAQPDNYETRTAKAEAYANEYVEARPPEMFEPEQTSAFHLNMVWRAAKSGYMKALEGSACQTCKGTRRAFVDALGKDMPCPQCLPDTQMADQLREAVASALAREPGWIQKCNEALASRRDDDGSR